MTRIPPRLPRPDTAPPKLAYSTRAPNHVPGFGVIRDSLLQRGVLVVREVLVDQGREQFALDEREHTELSIRQRRISVKDGDRMA